MPISMALFSPPPPTQFQPSLSHKPQFTLKSTPLFLKPSSNQLLLLSPPKASTENGAGISTSSSSAAVEEPKPVTVVSEPSASAPPETKKEESLGSNGAVADEEIKFLDPRWIGGTWDLNQFLKDGATDWDAVIDAEVRRRKWLETNPESSNNNEPVVFDTAIIPWWAWMKRFHLPEAELLNGRAAMVGFFMAYFVDSLTGVGLVDQMGNFFCKTLLLISVLGVLLIRKNEDVDKIKKLIEESNFYDKQWQATWKDDTTSKSE